MSTHFDYIVGAFAVSAVLIVIELLMLAHRSRAANRLPRNDP
jgi:hypothetical protein